MAILMLLADHYGGSSQPGYAGWVDIQTAQLGNRRVGSVDYTVTKSIDALSGTFYRKLNEGSMFRYVLVCFTDGATFTRTFRLDSVLVAALRIDGSQDNGMETVMFNAASLTEE
jgi:hypothetical protein